MIFPLPGKKNIPKTSSDELPPLEDAKAPFPMLALRDIVIYPNTIIPLSITGKKALDAIEKAMQSSRIIACFAVRPHAEEKKDSELIQNDFYAFGSTVLIHKLLRIPDGSVRLIVQGLDKVSLDEVIDAEPFFSVHVTTLTEKEPANKEGQALIRNSLTLLQKMINLVPYFPDEVQVSAMNMEDPVKLAYLLATFLRMKIDEKQDVLEILGGTKKLKLVNKILTRELELLELGGKIQTEVKDTLNKTQKQYFLREQMRAIKKELGELGEDEGEELKELEEQIKAAQLTEEAREIAQKELKRLERIPPASAEHQVIRTYIEWILEMPWSKSTKDKLDLKKARIILDQDHYDLEKIKDRIIEYLAVRKLKQDMKGPILCFAGPPGVGKTSLGKSIARAMGRKFIRTSLGGVRDEAEMRGHRRTYVGAMPGRIIQSIKRIGFNNPVMMLDEVDKVGSDFRGDPSSALLEILDPEQNKEFRDHYLDLAFDLSNVFFIATANDLSTIQPALRDRMEIIHLSGYSEEEKTQIARRYLVKKQVLENGLKVKQISFTKTALTFIIRNYTREAGVRNLEREIGKVCRKIATKVANGDKSKFSITPELVAKLLGPEKIFPEVARESKQPGIVTGLAWTPTGGDILFIEARAIPGKKNLILTGQLGDVMKESAQIALSYIRSIGKELKIAPEYFDTNEIHLHVPAGAIPKDGPSAGITLATALVSMITGKIVDNKLAMTGELTLTGDVLPIGGLKEKVLAAKRAGIKTILIPDKNNNDLREIDKELLSGLKFIKVKHLNDVLQHVFKIRAK